MNRFFKIREKINLNIFGYKKSILGVLRYFTVLVAFFVIAGVVYYYGFSETELSYRFNFFLVRFSLVFFLVRYIVQLFFDFHPLDFIRKRWFEGVVLLVFFVDALFPVFFESILYFHSIKLFVENHTLLLFQLYFLVIVFWELSHTASGLGHLKTGPATLLVLSFIFLILAGTGMLMLPEMTTGGHFHFLDALFTATSASCVTGLTVVDTATFFTLKGKVIIMVLIQLGGINIISFAAFFATLSQRKGGLKYQSLIKDLLSAEQLSDTRRILRAIIKWSLTIEIAGSFLLYFSWGNAIHFANNEEKVFSSVFHAISAFNNAGFSLFSDNLYQIGLKNMVHFQLIIALLVVTGGLGFFVLQDLFGISNIRQRFNFKWKSYHVSTKITLRMSGILVLTGTVVFFILEKNGVLAGKNFGNALVASLFQSITTRTAGFNTIDIASLTKPVLLFFMMLMFVGAGSGSTGGGIKVTTFALIIKSTIATIRGKKHVEFFKRNIPFEIVNKAYIILVYALFVISASIFALSITDPDINFVQLAFEEFSAFATVGLSTGITPDLSNAGKAIIIISMYVGRIGILSIAMMLSKKVLSSKYQYAKTSIMVG
ncbi:MAG: ATPase [Chlorobi bacterium]|nr:ATPase [Chlorobiota bacterium]